MNGLQSNVINEEKIKMKKLIAKYVNFLYHDLFIISLVIITTICWAYDQYLIGMIILAVLGISIFFLAPDLKPLMPVAAYYPYVLTQNEIGNGWPHNDFFIFLSIGVPLGVIGLIYHLKKQHFSFKTIKKGELFLGAAIAAIGMTLAGIFHPNYKFIYPIAYFGTGIGMLFFYVAFRNTLKKNVSPYLAKVLIYAGLAIIFQMIIYYLRADNLLNAIKYGDLRIGWGMRNTIGVILAMALFMFYYLGHQSKRFYLYIIGSYLYFLALVFTFSRGNLFITMILFVPMLIYTYFKTSFKKQLIITTSALSLITLLFIFFNIQIFKELMDSYIRRGLNSSGRISLWKESLSMWLRYPLFGVGFFGKFERVIFHGALLKVHSTPIQILTSSGIMGVIVLSKYYYDRYQFYFRRLFKNSFVFYSFLALLVYEGYGLIDLTLFMIYQLFFVIWFFVSIEVDEEESLVNTMNLLNEKKAVTI